MKNILNIVCLCIVLLAGGCATSTQGNSTNSWHVLDSDKYSAVFVNYFFSDVEKYKYVELDEKKFSQLLDSLQRNNNSTFYFWSEATISSGSFAVKPLGFEVGVWGLNGELITFMYSGSNIPHIFQGGQKVIIWWSYLKDPHNTGSWYFIDAVAIKK